MNNINSSNYFNVSPSTNKGMSGLISGMDTENMVKQMLSGTQGKIDKQEALKQQLQWKQEIYRDSIDAISGFSNKYFDKMFDSNLKNNFASASFFNSMTSSIKNGDAVKIVSTNSSASVGEIKLAVKQLAINASLKTSKHMSTDKVIQGAELTDEKMLANFSKKVQLKVGGQDIDVNLDDVTTESGMIDAFNNAFKKAGITDVSAKMYNDRMRLVTTNPDVSVEMGKDSSELGLRMSGLSRPHASDISDIDGKKTGNMLQGTQTDASAGAKFDVTFDGVKKTILLNNVTDDTGKITADSVKAALDKQLKQAFGDYVKVELSADKKITLSVNIKNADGTTENGHELNVTGIDAKKIGVTPGSSTHISGATKLGELGLNSDRFSFTINGREFSFNSKDSVGTVINRVNSSDAGVRLAYSSLSDSFSMEATSSGSQYDIKISQTEGNLLSAMFGDDKIKAASSVTSKELNTGSVKGKTGGIGTDYKTTGASMRMNVNGEDHVFSLPERKDTAGNLIPYGKSEIETLMNTWLKDKFGETEGKQNISLLENGELQTKEGFVVKFSQTSVDTENAKDVFEESKTDLALAFGFSTKASSNVVKNNTPIDSVLQLNGLDATDKDGNKAASLADITKINGVDVKFVDGRLQLQKPTGTDTVDLTSQLKLAELFGVKKTAADGTVTVDPIKLSDGQTVAGAITSGRDAKVIVNGTEVSRSSNSFTVDGLAMELTKESPKILDKDGNITGYEETIIGTSRDADKIVEGFKAFVEDYNAMVDKLNKYVTQEPTYRDYKPLTTDQKNEMSDKEVELWEEKAKEGLISGDSTINNFLSQMRTALYSKPTGSEYALYNIGIETAEYKYKDNGKITLNESTLRNAIAADPDAVKNLFTDSAEGIATQLTKIMDDTAKISSSTPGLLVKLAGVKGGALAKDNTLYNQTVNIEDRIKELKKKYESERQRYWNQFNQMESILSSYNAQSSMLSQQFSGY